MKNITLTSSKIAAFLLAAAPLCLPARADASGYLQVFSATQEVQWGEGTTYYPHTGYRIYSASGAPVKWVENQNAITDAEPESVELAPGRYTVWARSDTSGFLKMPVTIRAGKTTEVHF